MPFSRTVSRRTGAGAALTCGFAGLLSLASLSSPAQNAAHPKIAAPSASSNNVGGLSPEDTQVFSERFAKEVWPVMQENCVSCHGQKNASQLLLLTDGRAAFLKMMGEGFFDADNHASILERVATTDKQLVMPPLSVGKLSRAQIAVFTRFSEDLKIKRAASGGANPDEVFPAHLTSAFSGKKQAEGLDNTFVTFRQLRGKIKAIFSDDWVRDDRELFVDNVQAFGGADFVKRFDETAKASPTFLTAADVMSRDVASRAYLTRTGPFAKWDARTLASPTSLSAPSPAYKAAINTLYNRMLFRDANSAEIQAAWGFLQAVTKKQNLLAQTAPQDVRFSLTVKDTDNRQVSEDVFVRVSSDTHALRSEFVDQSRDAMSETDKTATRTLAGGPYTFAPGDLGQKIVVTNENTHGNVSLVSVTLRGPLPPEGETFPVSDQSSLRKPWWKPVVGLPAEKTITVSDPQARPEGAWRIKTDNGVTSYEDNNENKGASLVTFPVQVEKAGQYQVDVTWRRFSGAAAGKGVSGGGRPLRGAPSSGAENVLVEVVSRDKGSRVAVPPTPPVPPKGEAQFFVDETLDTLPYFDLKTAFLFGPGPTDGVEVRNDNTRKLVVADAVRLFPTGKATPTPGGEPSVVLRGIKAQGYKKWSRFKGGTFAAYNTVGPEALEDASATGDKLPGLSLLYKPTIADDPEGDKTLAYEPARFYRVGIVYPGRVENESRVPVVVHAQASSPIVQVAFPAHAHVGAPITLDASATYNLQHSPLTYTWTQIGGPRVTITDPHAPKIAFTAQPLSAQQAAWEGLCRALISHPDFLFTRPRSLASVTDAKTKRRLQLVKIAQDLVSRTPTQAEIAQVDKGVSLAKLVDGYLASPEFKDFYFHRVRLYLESHGTPEQDEPARLWTYLCLNDLPFKQILTADYTVGTDGKRAERPPYFGKTGVLTMKGFIQGKPGLPHFNYPAQVTEKFLGYVFEVPDEILQTRTGITASATTDPNSVCYTCHKVLTPLAYQRQYWDDEGNFRAHDETGMALDDSDNNLVASYPYKGAGLEAFATQAQNKERFVRTILQTHFVWYFGRELRYDTDERELYKRLWDVTVKNNYAIRPVIKALVLSPEYLSGEIKPSPTPKTAPLQKRMARLAAFHGKTVAGMGTK